MTSKTNQMRAERGEQWLRKHPLIVEELDQDLDESCVASAIADLLHCCNQNGIDIQHALKIANEIYIEELNGCDDYLDEPVEHGDLLTEEP